MVFGGLLLGKPSFSREKDGFEPKNHLFLEKTKKTKKTIFSKTMGLGPPKDGFFGFFGFLEKRWFFVFLFLEKKMVLPGEVLEKKIFTRRRPPKTIFFEKKMVFPGEDLQKPSFSREKDGFEPKNHLFLEKTKKTIFWRPQPHSFGKDVFFGFFGFLGFLFFVSFLFCCCSLDLARTRMPPAVGPLGGGGGGVSIYIYIDMSICIHIYIHMHIHRCIFIIRCVCNVGINAPSNQGPML